MRDKIENSEVNRHENVDQSAHFFPHGPRRTLQKYFIQPSTPMLSNKITHQPKLPTLHHQFNLLRRVAAAGSHH